MVVVLDHTIPLYQIPINSTDGDITFVQRPLIEPNKLTNDITCLGHSRFNHKLVSKGSKTRRL